MMKVCSKRSASDNRRYAYYELCIISIYWNFRSEALRLLRTKKLILSIYSQLQTYLPKPYD